MKVEYDKYYKTENLFGDPYPELIKLYSKVKHKGKLLDVGCGQGRDAVALAKMGFEVTGIDYSKVGIEQLNEFAKKEKISLTGVVYDIYKFNNYSEFDFVLLDSMFHFQKKDKERETKLIKNIFEQTKSGALITICIQSNGNKVEILNNIISEEEKVDILDRENLVYIFVDKESNHSSESKYEMVTLKKI